MIINVPFDYPVRYIPAKKRNELIAKIRDTAPIDIAEASDHDAPISFRCPPENIYRHRKKENPAAPIDYRAYGGRFWSPVDIRVDDDHSRQMTVEDLKDCATKGDHKSPFYRHLAERDWRGNERAGPKTLADLPPSCRFPGDMDASREESIAKLNESAADLLLVDGALWSPAHEILYVMDQRYSHGTGRNVNVMKVIEIHAVREDFEPSKYFRADRIDDALAMIAKQRGGKRAVKETEIERRIEVLRPEFLRYRYDMKPRMDKVAQEICQSMSRRLDDAEVPFMLAYAKLRDALKEEPRNYDAVAAIVGGDVAAVLDRDSQRVDAVTLRRDWIERTDPDTISSEDIASLSPSAAA